MQTEKKHDLRRLLALLASLLLLLLLLGLVFFSSRHRESDSTPVRLTPREAGAESLTLALGSYWKGWLRISGHKGEGCLENGYYPIRGRLDETDEGPAFELYDWEDRDGESPILSLYVTLDGSTMLPRIGRHDARFYDIWLDSRDVELFTLTLKDGVLSQSYFYNSGYETCRIEFQLEQEKNT